MKWFTSFTIGLVLILSLFSFTGAAKPTEGEIIDVWGQLDESMGDALEEVSDGILVRFGRPIFSSRVTTLEPFKLDKLTISLKNVSISEKNGLAIGFGNEEGFWIDSRGLFFLHFSKSTSPFLGDAPNGYAMSKLGNDLTDARTGQTLNALHDRLPKGDFEISFEKLSNGNWLYTFNGQAFDISKEDIDTNIPKQDKVYISFGSWGDSRGVIEYTITDISNKSTTPAPTAAPSNSHSQGTSPSGSASPGTSSNADPDASVQPGDKNSESGTGNGSGNDFDTDSDSDTDTDTGSHDIASVETSDQDASDSGDKILSDGQDSNLASDLDNSSDVEEDGEKKGGNTTTIIVIVVITLALAAAIIVGYFLVKKNKKNS